MNQSPRDALIDLLFQHMAAHIERGLDYDEALVLGVAEIRHQIRQSRGDLTEMLLGHAVSSVRSARDHGTRLH